MGVDIVHIRPNRQRGQLRRIDRNVKAHSRRQRHLACARVLLVRLTDIAGCLVVQVIAGRSDGCGQTVTDLGGLLTCHTHALRCDCAPGQSNLHAYHGASRSRSRAARHRAWRECCGGVPFKLLRTIAIASAARRFSRTWLTGSRLWRVLYPHPIAGRAAAGPLASTILVLSVIAILEEHTREREL